MNHNATTEERQNITMNNGTTTEERQWMIKEGKTKERLK